MFSLLTLFCTDNICISLDIRYILSAPIGCDTTHRLRSLSLSFSLCPSNTFAVLTLNKACIFSDPDFQPTYRLRTLSFSFPLCTSNTLAFLILNKPCVFSDPVFDPTRRLRTLSFSFPLCTSRTFADQSSLKLTNLTFSAIKGFIPLIV